MKRHKSIANAHRPRAVQACRSCAEAKLRCDGSPPCLRCRERGFACEFPEPRQNGSTHSRQPAALENVTLVPVDTTQHSIDPSISTSATNRLMSNSELSLDHGANPHIPSQFAPFPEFEQREFLPKPQFHATLKQVQSSACISSSDIRTRRHCQF